MVKFHLVRVKFKLDIAIRHSGQEFTVENNPDDAKSVIKMLSKLMHGIARGWMESVIRMPEDARFQEAIDLTVSSSGIRRSNA